LRAARSTTTATRGEAAEENVSGWRQPIRGSSSRKKARLMPDDSGRRIDLALGGMVLAGLSLVALLSCLIVFLHPV
jgi:hypothetical protein